MGVLKRIFGSTKPYKFARWLLQKYHDEVVIKSYTPEQFSHFGRGVTIEPNVLITHPQHVVLNDRVLIHGGSTINSSGGLFVGENTGIGYNCSIFTVQHNYRDAESIPFDRVAEMKPVIIREYVWIGMGAMIFPGVEIGEGSIIGMGAVVVRNVPPLAIVVGNPGEVIMYRDREHYQRCKAQGKIQDLLIERYDYRMIDIYKHKYAAELKAMQLL